MKDFEVHHKNPSEEALLRWRKAVSIVKNPRRRFRMVADLVKRSEAEKKKRSIQVFLSLYIEIFSLLLICILEFSQSYSSPKDEIKEK